MGTDPEAISMLMEGIKAAAEIGILQMTPVCRCSGKRPSGYVQEIKGTVIPTHNFEHFTTINRVQYLS